LIRTSTATVVEVLWRASAIGAAAAFRVAD
jgi:hypothetical protein